MYEHIDGLARQIAGMNIPGERIIFECFSSHSQQQCCENKDIFVDIISKIKSLKPPGCLEEEEYVVNITEEGDGGDNIEIQNLVDPNASLTINDFYANDEEDSFQPKTYFDKLERVIFH